MAVTDCQNAHEQLFIFSFGTFGLESPLLCYQIGFSTFCVVRLCENYMFLWALPRAFVWYLWETASVWDSFLKNSTHKKEPCMRLEPPPAFYWTTTSIHVFGGGTNKNISNTQLRTWGSARRKRSSLWPPMCVSSLNYQIHCLHRKSDLTSLMLTLKSAFFLSW